VEENRAGLVIDSFKSIHAAVAALTARMSVYRAGVGRIHNRAIFEIPGILERILHTESRRLRGRPSQHPLASVH
jgi:hypothetical protein